jgi:hypothetical protein
VKTAAKQVADTLLSYVETYTEHVNTQMKTQITNCRNVEAIAATSVKTICDDTLNPQNAYWLCMALCVLLTIPAVIFASCLRDLYRNTEPYTGIDYGGMARPRRVSSANGSGVATPRHRRLSAFMTDTYDNTSRHRKLQRDHSGYTQWRNDSGSSGGGPTIEEVVTTPPPPYTSHYATTSARRL